MELSHQPVSTLNGGNVTVRLTLGTGTGDDTSITASPTMLYFDTSNWNTAQTVTLRAADDSDTMAGSRAINHSATGGGYSANRSLTATEADDDNIGAIVLRNAADNGDITTLDVPEGSTATYKVELSEQPQADVTVAISAASDGDTDITVKDTDDGTAGDQTTVITFTSSNWDTARTVTLAAAEDSGAAMDGTRTITHTASGANSGYADVTKDLTAKELDNDKTVILMDSSGSNDISSITVTEESTATYKVKLGHRPEGNVTVTLTATGDTDITFNPSSLTFATNNWSNLQTVTITAGDDNDQEDGTKTITHTAAGGRFHNITATLTVTEIDNDAPGVQGQQAEPGPPGNVSASRSGGGIVTSWDAASNATGYHVVYSTDGKASWTRAASDHSGTSYTISGADDSLAYVVGVQAVNSAGVSGWVNSNTVPAQSQQQAPPANPPGNVSGLSASRSSGSIVANWDAPSGATKYHVTYTTDGGSSWSLAAAEHSTNSITIVNADNAKAYIVGVRAGNSAGWSGWVNSNEVPKVTPPPGSVGSVSATHNGGTVSVTWDAASDATGYDVVYSTDGKASWSRAATNQGGTSYTLDNADSSKTYVFGVRAVNESGESGWTNSAPATHNEGG